MKDRVAEELPMIGIGIGAAIFGVSVASIGFFDFSEKPGTSIKCFAIGGTAAAIGTQIAIGAIQRLRGIL